jgi:hypothetical protein
MLGCSTCLTIAAIALLLRGAVTLVMPALLSCASILFMYVLTIRITRTIMLMSHATLLLVGMVGYVDMNRCTMTVWPLYLSYRFAGQQRLQAQSLQRLTRLAEFLAYPQGYELFLQFTTTEFCSELLFFWKHVEEYRSYALALANPNHTSNNNNNDDMSIDVMRRAIMLFETYISSSSMFEINISATSRMELAQRLALAYQKVHGETVVLPPSLIIATSPTAAMIKAAAARAKKHEAFAAANNTNNGGNAATPTAAATTMTPRGGVAVPESTPLTAPLSSPSGASAATNIVTPVGGGSGVTKSGSSRPSSKSGKSTISPRSPRRSPRLLNSGITSSNGNAIDLVVAIQNETKNASIGVAATTAAVAVPRPSSSDPNKASRTGATMDGVASATMKTTPVTATISSMSGITRIGSTDIGNTPSSIHATPSYNDITLNNPANRYLVATTPPPMALTITTPDTGIAPINNNMNMNLPVVERDNASTNAIASTNSSSSLPWLLPMQGSVSIGSGSNANSGMGMSFVNLASPTNIGFGGSNGPILSTDDTSSSSIIVRGSNSTLPILSIRMTPLPNPMLVMLSSLFDTTQTTVVDLLQINSFSRFRSSRMFKAFIAELEKGTATMVCCYLITHALASSQN